MGYFFRVIEIAVYESFCPSQRGHCSHDGHTTPTPHIHIVLMAHIILASDFPYTSTQELSLEVAGVRYWFCWLLSSVHARLECYHALFVIRFAYFFMSRVGRGKGNGGQGYHINRALLYIVCGFCARYT